MKYRKKPVIIEAMQWKDHVESHMTISEWSGQEWKWSIYGKMYIPTLEGTMTANKGDWIIKGVNGEFYPCKPDIFEKTYEIVEG